MANPELPDIAVTHDQQRDIFPNPNLESMPASNDLHDLLEWNISAIFLAKLIKITSLILFFMFCYYMLQVFVLRDHVQH